MRWRVIALASVLACQVYVARGEPASDPRIQVLPDPSPLSDFELTDQEGRPYRFSRLRGSDAIVFFGFTHCPSICPAALLEMKLVTQAIEQSGQKAPAAVFVSVDGERDTPEVVKKYLTSFPSSFVGLTGDPKSVRKIAAEFKAVFFKGLPHDNAGSYQVEHTSFIYLVDAEGRLRATFLDAPVDTMAAAVRQSRSAQPRNP